jgi:hypothetical protein
MAHSASGRTAAAQSIRRKRETIRRKRETISLSIAPSARAAKAEVSSSFSFCHVVAIGPSNVFAHQPRAPLGALGGCMGLLARRCVRRRFRLDNVRTSHTAVKASPTAA